MTVATTTDQTQSQNTTAPSDTNPATTSSPAPATSAATYEPAKAPDAPAAPPAEASKSTDAAPPASTTDAPAPEATSSEYEIEVADSSPLSDDDLAAIAAHAEKYSLTKDEAMALVKRQEDLYAKGANTSKQAEEQRIQEMKTALNTHPYFTGDKRQESLDAVTLAVKTFGNEKVVEALKQPENGYNVDLAIMLRDIGMALRGDTTPPPRGGVNTENTSKVESESEKLQRLYPKFYKDDKK